MLIKVRLTSSVDEPGARRLVDASEPASASLSSTGLAGNIPFGRPFILGAMHERAAIKLK